VRQESWSRVIAWGVALAAAVVAVMIAVWSGEHSHAPSAPANAARPQPNRQTGGDQTRAVCAAQLEKLGQALRLYAADHRGQFPLTPTPAVADQELLPALQARGGTRGMFHCPALGPDGAPYLYHCYQSPGADRWPKWMPATHVVTVKSPTGTWLMSDYLARDRPGPHSQTEKAFNYLCADGHVRFHLGSPRQVYR